MRSRVGREEEEAGRRVRIEGTMHIITPSRSNINSMTKVTYEQ